MSAQTPQARVDTLTGAQPFVLHPFTIPGTLIVTVDGVKMDSSEYRLDTRFHRLWIPSISETTVVMVRYRVWDLNLPDRYARVFEPPPNRDSTSVVSFTEPVRAVQSVQLRRSGSITRGVLTGNNRDATIESGLRLQMSGQLAPDIHVRAALTDENTPILPEGTTQRLSELDRVFIEIETPVSSAQFGDFGLKLDRTMFARLNRKIQGVELRSPVSLDAIDVTVRGAAATSRGVFKTQDLQVTDGVQGPYRLRGNANEHFILVIPGSESVYLDGILLERGESRDYVIDYATGEITFTTRRMIKYHHRIAVEFQYRTTEFTRTLSAAEATVSTKVREFGSPLASLGVTFIREADGKSFDQEFGLTAADRELLAELGDRQASRTSASAVTYDPDAPWIHYTARDTMIAGQHLRIYLPLTKVSGQDVFRVEFTRVGPGQGAYIRQGQTTNGIFYSYRGPGQGEYLPIRVLPKPKQQRMLDLRGSFTPIRNLEILGEWAHSFRDENRFSSLDAADNRANSYHVRLGVSELSVGVGEVDLVFDRQQTGKNFAVFDRIRPVEFVRSWNLPLDRGLVQLYQETIDEASTAWRFFETSSIRATLGRLRQGSVFRGDRREVALQINEAYFPKLNYLFMDISSDADSVRGTWVRHEIQSSQALVQGRMMLTTRFETSQRYQYIPKGLRQDSKQYWELSPSAELRGDWGKFSVAFDWRDEHLWAPDHSLRPGRRTATTSVDYTTHRQRSFQSEGRMGVRYTAYTDFFQSTQGLADERSLVIRWNGRAHPWDRLLRIHWFYEALSEQTPVLQEIYIRTGSELGEFVWEDANQNGIIELDEFIPEVTQDEGQYVRTLIPSDSLQSVTGVNARLNVQFDGNRRWRNLRTGWVQWLRWVSLKSSIEVQEKSKDPDPVNLYLLRQRSFRHPENSIRGTLNLMQDLWLFRNHPRYGMHASWRQIRSTNVFAATTETRSLDEFRVRLRWQLGDQWVFNSEGSFSDKVNTSTAFNSRDFDIRARSLVQQVQYTTPFNLRMSAGVDYAHKDARIRGRAIILKLPVQSSWDRAGRFNLTSRLEFANVKLAEQAGSRGLALFELTDGRGAGHSFLWRLSGWFQLNQVLRANLSYTGRSVQNAPNIHTTRLQLSATF